VRFAFGDCLLDADRRELRRGGDPVAIEPQVFDLLVYLLANRDRVVSKDELIAEVWHGRIVSDSTLTSRVNAARAAVGDNGAAQLLIRTIARKGLRFAAEVTEENAPAASPAGDPSLVPPDKPSVAVLPFANMSSDPEQEYFADGVAEDVITALSRYPSLFVIARNSTFTYKGRAVEVRQVGRELGVRYVLEGSLRKSANRIRVTAQLVEAETGSHVWAERYDRDLADIFAVQDEISEAVTTAMAPAIGEAERRRAMRKPPNSLDAWAAFQRGLWHLEKEGAENQNLAEVFCQRAIDLDPNFAGSFVGLAHAVIVRSVVYGLRELPEALDVAERAVRRAIALDSTDADARACLAVALRMRGDASGSLAEAERALALNPNLASAHGVRGAVLVFTGRWQEGIAALEKSIRLDPRDPRAAGRLVQKTVGLYFSRDYEATVDFAKASIRAYPHYPLTYRWLAAALGQLGCTA
jgi:adenylate cyclase